MPFSPSRSVSLIAKSMMLALATSVILTTAGCGMGTSAGAGSGLGESPISGSALSGIAHGGRQPITSANVFVMAAGKAGYGSAAKILAETTTNPSTGAFNFSSGAYTCPLSTDVNYSDTIYIIVAGGNPGVNAGTSTTNNTASVLLAVLGDCATVVANQPFVGVSEVSTFAGMTAMQQFFNPASNAALSSASPPAAGAAESGENFGTSSGNIIGLQYAAGGVPNLVGTLTGLAVTSNLISTVNGYSGSNATGVQVTATPETSKINLAANVLASCVNSNPGSDTVCSTLFPLLSSAAIIDTLQAAYYMASNPTSTVSGTSNIGTIVNNASAFAPYSPTIAVTASSYPNDWTIAVKYTSASFTTVTGGTGKTYFLQDPAQVAIDSNGLVWIENAFTSTATTVGNSISQIDPTGVPMQVALIGATGLTINEPHNIVIDQNNNVFASNYGNTSTAVGTTVTEYPSCSSPCGNSATSVSTAVTFTTGAHPASMAIDGSGNLFVADQAPAGAADLEEVTASTISSTSGGGSATATVLATGLAGESYFDGMVIDSSANVYLDNGSTAVYKFPVSGYGTYATFTGSSLVSASGLDIDGSDNLFASNSGTSSGFVEIPSGTATGATATGTIFGTTSTTNGGASGPERLTIDGAGDIWGTNFATPGGLYEFTHSLVAISPSGASPAVGFGSITGSTLTARTYLGSNVPAIDLSGNIWVGATTGSTASTLTEVVGAAVPVVVPIAAGLPQHGGPSHMATRPLAQYNIPGSPTATESAANGIATITVTFAVDPLPVTTTLTVKYADPATGALNGTVLCTASATIPATGGPISCSNSTSNGLGVGSYNVSGALTSDGTEYSTNGGTATLVVGP